MEDINNTTFYKVGSGLLASLIWSGWAYFVNENIASSVTQGMASFFITLFLVHIVSKIYYGLSSNLHLIIRFLIPAITSVTLTGTCLYFAHRIVGTEHIINTITPALLVAFVFCIFTTFRLSRGTQNA